MSEQKKNPDELGALWIKHGAKGEYLTGEVDGVKVVCFRNDRKPEGSRQPDYRVMKSKPREQQAAAPVTDSDIPF